MHAVFPSINGASLEEGHSAATYLYVDGSFHISYRFDSSFDEVVSLGFTETEEFLDGTSADRATVRKYVFQKAETHDGKSGNSSVCESRSSVRLEVYSGEVAPFNFSPKKRDFKVGIIAEKVSEKEAIKEGKSVNIAPSFDTVKQDVVKSLDCIPDPTSEGSVHVFFRELFWRQSRRLIDRAGNPWSPQSKPIRDFIDLVN